MTPTGIALAEAIEQVHTKSGPRGFPGDERVCDLCDRFWPCNATQAAAEIRALVKIIEVRDLALRLANESCEYRDRIIAEGVETRKLALLPDSEVAVLVAEKDAEIRALHAKLAEAERDTYPHMCQSDHDRIGWSGEEEECPVCRMRNEAERENAELRELLNDD